MSGNYNIGIRSIEDVDTLHLNNEIREFLQFLLNRFAENGFDGERVATVATDVSNVQHSIGVKIPRNLSGDTATGEKHVKVNSIAYKILMDYIKDKKLTGNLNGDNSASKVHTVIKTYLGIDLLSGNGKEGPSTSQQELLTSLICWIKRNKTKTITKTVFEDAYKANAANFKVSASTSLAITVEKLWKIYESNDSGWRTSADIIADKFATSFSNFNGISVYYGSASGPLAKLYRVAKTAIEREGLKMDANKWTPADVWFLTKAGASTLQALKENSNIHDLNSLLLKEIHAKNILPISLKKVKSSATVKEYNFTRDTKGKNIFPHNADEIKNIKILKLDNKHFFSTGAGAIEFTLDRPSDNIHLSERITARTFNGATAFALEIDGTHAKGGKTNIKTLETVIRKICNVPVTIQHDYDAIAEHLGNTTKSAKPESLLEFYNKIKMLSNLATQHKVLVESEDRASKFLSHVVTDIAKYQTSKHHNNILNLEYERFVTEFDRKALAWRVSKFILVEMLYYIFHSASNRNSSAKLKQIILELFQVASSQHEVSAPFFKIS